MEGVRLITGLQKALEYGGGTHTVADVLDQIDAGEARLWAEGESAIVTEIQQTPQKKILHFWLATGELDAVIRLSKKAEEWGREQGCVEAVLAGRKGWERALSKQGWSPMLTLMGKAL